MPALIRDAAVSLVAVAGLLYVATIVAIALLV
jgi:hypothetical protein